MSSRSAPRPLVGASIDLIQSHQASTGAFIAAPGYSAYAYCWLRDGAFISTAIDSQRNHASAAAFRPWAAPTIENHAHKVKRLEAEAARALKETGKPIRLLDDSHTLHTRFTIDGEEGHDLWGNFQLDGYGFWLASVVRHCTVTGTNPAPFQNAIDLVCRYLMLTWEHPCFDSWEEYPTRRHATTWAAIAKGLHDSGHLLDNTGAVEISRGIITRLVRHCKPGSPLPKFVPDTGKDTHTIGRETSEPSGMAIAGHERIGRPLRADAIDGSALLVLGPFGPFSPAHEIVSGTLRAIEDKLVVEGGVHRYLEDEYYGGGLWIVLAGALAYAQAPHNPERSNEILDWIEAQADIAGHLSEQTSSHLCNPESLKPWIERWGLPAKPLLWSHAMYLLGVASLESETSRSIEAPPPGRHRS